MNKLAVFVEGYTEMVFVEKLIEEIAGRNKVLIEKRRISGGSSAPRRMKLLQAAQPDSRHEYYVMIVDCGGDRQVKSRVVEEHENLTKANYACILGLRDVRPDFTRADLPKLEAGLRLRIRTSLCPVDFILAVMEIEAWFLAESSHFPRIDPALTAQAIHAALGFDPHLDDMELREKPADDLDQCYALAGQRYRKGNAPTTVAALDFAAVYLALRARFNHLDRLVSHLEAFLTS
jgi:hypothetical protein